MQRFSAYRLCLSQGTLKHFTVVCALHLAREASTHSLLCGLTDRCLLLKVYVDKVEEESNQNGYFSVWKQLFGLEEKQFFKKDVVLKGVLTF